MLIKDKHEIVQKHWYLLHWIHHKKKIDDYENIYSISLLYLIIGKVDEFIEEKNENKYLVFDSTDKNKEVLKNTQNFGMGLKMRMRIIGGKAGEYGKDFKKIKFSLGYDIPLNKPLNFLALAIVVRSVF